jgi:hypothetical protein
MDSTCRDNVKKQITETLQTTQIKEILGNFEEAAGRVRVEVANMGPSSLIEIW